MFAHPQIHVDVRLLIITDLDFGLKAGHCVQCMLCGLLLISSFWPTSPQQLLFHWSGLHLVYLFLFRGAVSSILIPQVCSRIVRWSKQRKYM